MNNAQYQSALGGLPAKPKKPATPKGAAKPKKQAAKKSAPEIIPTEITEDNDQAETEIDGAGE